MKIRSRSLMVSAAALAVAAGVLAGGGVANAAVTPSFEPDPNAIGHITLYNASGAVITGGSLTTVPFAAFASASGPGRAGDTRAFIRVATPKAATPTDQFVSAVVTNTTNYPNTNAPAPLNTSTNPLVSATTGQSLAAYIAANPNTETAPALANIYQVRLITTAPGQSADVNYFRVDIQVDTAAGTWTVVHPASATPTTTTLSATPASPVNSGTAVTLTANVSPAGTAGSVRFFDGATDLGAGTYNAATGAATFTGTPSVGSHSYTAQFTPNDTSAFNGSTSSALPFTVNAPGTPTTTTLSANPPSGTAAGSGGTLDVTLTANVAPVGTAGSVAFFDGSTSLGQGTYDAATGTATLVKTLATGNHLLVATFTPSVNGFQSSTSSIVNYAVVGANSAAVPLEAQNNTDPFAGALVLQVAAGTKVQLTQIPVNDPNGHPVLATDPTGHRHAWVFTGTLTGVSVNDTRPTQDGWTLNGQAADFHNGSTVVPASYLGWVPASAGGDAEGTVAAGPSVDSKLKTESSVGLSTSNQFAKAAPGNGLGTKDLTSSLELRIPDTSPTGLYTSTLTLTLVSP
ncbi:Ig-like domain-containing protein [Dactylosporangium sp. AC04546]|uniref:Ig-like domain-containing protein n=1 Tax=Dactylosporangium sp. AC04546 TaxID=2862460 RepID=UPI001EDFF6A5|nr:Ig-like domain-containing protein [Dactylosporangium sp. AC04546]WVK85017.1 Ig-like domain-containing protein [Dactylosporangium sp. AC04546]